jgi:hypothetical protein
VVSGTWHIGIGHRNGVFDFEYIIRHS